MRGCVCLSALWVRVRLKPSRRDDLPFIVSNPVTESHGKVGQFQWDRFFVGPHRWLYVYMCMAEGQYFCACLGCDFYYFVTCDSQTAIDNI